MADVDLLRYPMNNTRRGLALIFGYKKFSQQQNLVERLETNIDVSQMEMRLKSNGFEIIKHINKSKGETLEAIDTTLQSRAQTLRDSDCVVVVFSSYGADGVIFATDKHMMFYEDILDRFNGVKCPALIGKPKLFIVQASPLKYQLQVEAGLMSKPIYEQYMIPSEANTVIAWNPLPGVLDKKKEQAGSVFIRSFCENLRIYGKDTSIPTIIRKTIKNVSHILERDYPNMMRHYEYKVPYMVNMLTKEFTMSPKK